jgi:hypothetical protein
MVVLAVILLLLVTIVGLSAILAGDGPASLNLVGADIVTTERVLFLTGAVSAATAAFALWLLFKGLKRARSRRAEIQRLRAAAAAPARSHEVGGPPGATQTHSTRPTAYPTAMRRPDDDERDHFDSLPRE